MSKFTMFQIQTGEIHMGQKMREAMSTKSFLISITSFIVKGKSTVHINKRLLNIGALPSKSEYAQHLQKEFVNNKMHLFLDP